MRQHQIPICSLLPLREGGREGGREGREREGGREGREREGRGREVGREGKEGGRGGSEKGRGKEGGRWMDRGKLKLTIVQDFYSLFLTSSSDWPKSAQRSVTRMLLYALPIKLATLVCNLPEKEREKV